MKIKLTAIVSLIFVFTVFISVILTKQYRSHAANQMNASVTTIHTKQTEIQNAVTTTEKKAVETAQKIQANPGKNNNENTQIAGVNVKKMIAVASSQGLQPKALKSALNAYAWAKDHKKLGSNKNIITVVDFTMPSYEKRMWVLNLQQNKVLMKLYTTQGAGSGVVYANRFSNTSRTQATSIGLYTTSDEYYGKHGISMRLDGLQKGINSNARNRSIVIHEAAYASPAYIKANGRAGRSWGCFAVAPESKNTLLNYVRGGSAFFAYARPIEKNSIVSNGPLYV